VDYITNIAWRRKPLESPDQFYCGPQLEKLAAKQFDALDTNILVSNQQTARTIINIRVSDAAVIGTFAIGVNPEGVAFDGANVWVVNVGSNTVSKR